MRWQREARFISWAQRTELADQFPRLIGASFARKWIITSFLSGSQITAATPDLLAKAALTVQGLLGQAISDTHLTFFGKDDFLDVRRVSREFEHRRRSLEAKTDSLPASCACKRRLRSILSKYSLADFRNEVRASFVFGRDASKSLGRSMVMSPSDFGFHNCLYDEATQKLMLFDFEYAGLDSPFKLIMDFCFQPNVSITQQHVNAFLSNLQSFPVLDFSSIPEEIKRTFSVKWASIILSKSFKNGRHSCSDTLLFHLDRFDLWS